MAETLTACPNHHSHMPQQRSEAKKRDHARHTPPLHDLRREESALPPAPNMLALPGSVVLRREVPEAALEGAQEHVRQGLE